jgi:bacteriocin-like protein
MRRMTDNELAQIGGGIAFLALVALGALYHV